MLAFWTNCIWNHLGLGLRWFCFGVLVAGVGFPLLCQTAGYGEDLISNGGFESKKWCPSDYTQSELKTLKNWWQANAGTPDHFDLCAGNGSSGVPKNMFGSQLALEGDAYGGMVLYSSSKPNYREYLQTELKRPLVAGEWICVEWWVCAADEARLITDGLGVAFTAEAIKKVGEGRLDLVPNVSNPLLHMLSDRWSWLRLSDAFEASGGERFVTIGNFLAPEKLRVMERQDASTPDNNWAYVYIDDIRIRPVIKPEDCSCLNATIREQTTDPPWQSYQRNHVRWDAVLFDFDSFELNELAKGQIEAVAAEMRDNRFLVIEVNGHTDWVGSDGYNLVLSERRAQTVLSALQERGVDPNRLKLSWHGSTKPVAENDSELGRQQNRRVDFELLEHAFLPAQ